MPYDIPASSDFQLSGDESGDLLLSGDEAVNGSLALSGDAV